MEYRILGNTGVTVSKFCFGAGMFGYFGNSDEKECTRMVDRAIDAGINYFDTSDVYSHGESETILGKALKGNAKTLSLPPNLHFLWMTTLITGALPGVGLCKKWRTASDD